MAAMPTRAQRCADLVRARLGFERPPASPAMLVAHAPIEVFALDWPDDLAGLLAIRGESAFIGLNKWHSHARRHFSFWHEVGHYVMHRGRSQVTCWDTPWSRDAAREREANAFAAAITMPANWLASGLDESPDLDDLARRFKVSRQALALRLEELGLSATVEGWRT